MNMNDVERAEFDRARCEELDRLIRVAEDLFDNHTGEPAAYFIREDRRHVYHVASFGLLLHDVVVSSAPRALGVFMESMLRSMHERGGRRVYWRHGQRFELRLIHNCQHGGDLLELVTRLVVTDLDGVQIPVPPWFPTTHPGRLITREMLEDGIKSLDEIVFMEARQREREMHTSNGGRIQ